MAVLWTPLPFKVLTASEFGRACALSNTMRMTRRCSSLIQRVESALPIQANIFG